MAYEYTTTALVQAELQASTAFSSSTLPTEAQITEWIQEDSAYVTSLAQTLFTTSAATTEFFDYNGGDTLVFQNGPVVSITQISYNNNPLGSSLGSSWSNKTEDTDYTNYLDIGMVRLLRNNWNPNPGVKRIRGIYTYGYSTTPIEVQMLVSKLVANRALETLINKNVNERNDGGTTSVGSISIVEPANYGVGSYKQLKKDIDQLKREIVKNFQTKRSYFHDFV